MGVPGKRTRLRLSQMMAVTAIVLIVAMPVSAQEPDSPGTVDRVFSSMNPTNWRLPPFLKMPKFSGILPAKQERMRITKKKDSLVDDVRQTATASWQRTKQAFSPQNLNPINYLPASARTDTPVKKEAEPGFFRSLFSPPPQPEPPSTLTGFLRQPKPRS